MISRFGFNEMQDVASALTKIADRLTSKEDVTKMRLFVENNKQQLGESAATSVGKALNETEWQMEWSQHHGPLIRTFLNHKKNSATATTFSVVVVLGSLLSYYLLI
jgi:hypothetical protein